ncbi:hypothetical protein Back2_11090 [Nocardioides baekrokdamisoli]|uniref:HTH cro/C1-type domain-containing protein n=1 Tax=Nocardioides baekrokdamisoli TaxID=1804624 RepID=A0A3G9IEV5_9ACTN|nr:helix-turn-helix transcriptional regulator [Nocardioides baekrokdamisoli]BBH16822.1 hypothetical protein Back2_11090 [Nocardioides baekrokdamisoli]
MTGEFGPLLAALGANLRAERVRRNLTQEAVAGRSGLAVTQLARMERGETDSGISKYVRVAAAIGISPVDLFWNVDLQVGGEDR